VQILGQWGVNKRSSKGGDEVKEEEPVGSRNSLTGLLMSRSEHAAASKPPASPIPDIDAADRGDPLTAAEYVEDIFAYYRRVESIFRTAPDYMKDQVGGLAVTPPPPRDLPDTEELNTSNFCSSHGRLPFSNAYAL